MYLPWVSVWGGERERDRQRERDRERERFQHFKKKQVKESKIKTKKRKLSTYIIKKNFVNEIHKTRTPCFFLHKSPDKITFCKDVKRQSPEGLLLK